MKHEAGLDLDNLIAKFRARNASDFFLLPGEPPAIRVPTEFEIERLDQDPLTAEDITAVAVALLGEDRLDRIGEDTGALEVAPGPSGYHDIGFCVAKSRGAFTVSGRFFPDRVLTAEEIGLPQPFLEAADAPNGIVIFTGPIGSGKTTSAMAWLDHINSTRSCHICTVEDPSYPLIAPKKSIIQQRVVGLDIPSVEEGIRVSLRQDLDVLFVGEIRSAEELEACLTAAETGHLVATQLHLPTPETALPRMVEVFPEDMQKVFRESLSRLLRAVLAQKLLPKVGGGRVAAYGVLVPDATVREAIRTGSESILTPGQLPAGSQCLSDHVNLLLEQGSITPETAQAASSNLGPQ